MAQHPMMFEPSEDLRQLVDSLQRLAARAGVFEHRHGRGPGPLRSTTWPHLAEIGLLALAVPPDHGGLGGRWRDLLEPMEVVGAALWVEPVVQTLVAAQLLLRTAGPARCAELLPDMVRGGTVLVLAHQEPDARHRRSHVGTIARPRADGGWTLQGRKCVVHQAQQADRLLVSARTAGPRDGIGGISLFLVDPREAGVRLQTYRTFDQFPAADLDMDLRLPPDALLGQAGMAGPAIDAALDLETALWCAQACGAMAAANALTLEYLKTRRQFGVPIGSFQVLQHRMVDMTVELELARSMAWLASARADADIAPQVRRRSVSAAKLRVGEAARAVAQAAVQLHGGIGLTDEMKISHLFRRLTAFCLHLGDADFHLERYRNPLAEPAAPATIS